MKNVFKRETNLIKPLWAFTEDDVDGVDSAIGYQCVDCGSNIGIILGHYKDKRFKLISEDANDPLNNRVMVTCPVCHRTHIVPMRVLKILHFKEVEA